MGTARTPVDLSLRNRLVWVSAGPVRLEGDLTVPDNAGGIVLFAHGSGSSRYSPRNRHVASRLRENGLATLLFDLFTPEEEVRDRGALQLPWDIDLLAQRLIGATEWAAQNWDTRDLRAGYFGASTGAAAALLAAAERPELVHAVVSRGGRPDLAGEALSRVRAPTLLIVGGNDTPVVELSRKAMSLLKVETQLEIVPNATHLFEEPGALDEVVRLAGLWLGRHLGRSAAAPGNQQS